MNKSELNLIEEDPNTLIFLIHELWYLPMEKDISSAMGYKLIGYVKSREKAQKIVDDAGVREGTGWPIREGQKVPKKKFTEVSLIE